MKKSVLLSIAFIVTCFSCGVLAQGVGVNSSGNQPDPSAIFDASSTTKGALFPRMTSAQRDAIVSPAKGLTIYNTDCDNLNCNTGTPSVPNWTAVFPSTVVAAPVGGVHSATVNSITWNWSAVSGATGYKWSTSNSYGSAIDIGAVLSYLQTGLTCNSSYTLYVWAYNACGPSPTATILTHQTSNCPFICGTSLTDSRDNQSYGTVLIGSQCWMSQNLNYSTSGTYINGSVNQTDNAIVEKYCYNNNVSFCNSYGGLYTWAEMVQYLNGASNSTSWNPVPTGNIKGICPTGWHIPTHDEWTTLEQAVCAISPSGGNCATNFPYDITTTGFRGTDESQKLKSTSWGGTNSSGFNGLQSGSRYPGGSFIDQSSNVMWMSATEYDATRPWARNLYSGYTTIARHYAWYAKENAYSVRCLKD